MIQYPRGGGFLNCHNDFDPFYPSNMINVLLPITTKSKKDKNLKGYSSGGLYYFLKIKKFL